MIHDERQAARDLARFVRELRRLERRTVQQVLLDVAGQRRGPAKLGCCIA